MICKTCGETMVGDGYKTPIHCPSIDADGVEPDANPVHCEEITMTFEEYIPKAMKTAVFKHTFYPFASLTSETCELADIFIKAWLRGDNDGVPDRAKVIKEAGDCCWNLAALYSLMPRRSDEIYTEYYFEFHVHAYEHLLKLKAQAMALEMTAAIFLDWAIDAQETIKLEDDATLQYLSMLNGYKYLLCQLLEAQGITLEEVLEVNLAKLADREARGVLQGSGDNR